MMHHHSGAVSRMFFTLGLAVLSACGGGISESDSPYTKLMSSPARSGITSKLEHAAESAAPQLGAHVLLAQNEFSGTSPAVTPPTATQAQGSTLIALSMGWLRNLSAPTDTYQNSWESLSGPNIYFSSDFYTAVWAAPAAAGGPGHRLSFDKAEYPAGEISMALIEVMNGGQVSHVYQLAPAANQSPGSITVDGPATLIAVWGGDGYSFQNTAVPDNGFTVIDSYLNFVPAGDTAVQVAIATKQVNAAGTYTVRWASSPSQNCACYLIAVRNGGGTPPDTVPPTGSVSINGGAPSTTDPAVTLTLSATDNASGVTQMRFSNDGVNFSVPQAYATTAAWTLPTGDGVKTVFAQFRDGAGNWSTGPTNDNIALTTPPPPADTTPPTGSIVINNGAGSTSQSSVNLTLAATDNATGVAQMRFSNDGISFTAPVAYASGASWQLSDGNGTKTVFVQFQDGAGNWSSSFTDDIALMSGARPGLVAAFGFNEGQGNTTADTSGNGLTGSLSNTNWSSGKFGGALGFTGRSSSRVTVPSAPVLQFNTGFTMSAWVNPQAAQSTEPTVIAKEVAGGLSYVLYAKGSGTGPNAYALKSDGYHSAAASGVLPAGVWSYLTASYDGSQLKVYVNGTLAGSTAMSGTFLAGTGALRIGNNAVFSNEGFAGRIDEVRVYNRALSSAEILADMQTAVGAE